MRSSWLIILAFLFFSCDKQVENFTAEKAVNYYPIQTGKYRTYRLDSTVTTNFGKNLEVHSYQEKHVVDAAIVENNLSGYRIQRYIRNLNATTEPWKSAGSYFVSVGENVQLVEDNLRFIKLATPVKTGVQWNGNAYLPNEPYSGMYAFNNDDDMKSWRYEYKSTGEALTLNSKSFTDVATVQAINESLNVPVTSTQIYAYKNYYLEKYAKGVGLVYQEYVMYEFQPDNADRPGYRGFGVKRSIIDYN